MGGTVLAGGALEVVGWGGGSRAKHCGRHKAFLVSWLLMLITYFAACAAETNPKLDSRYGVRRSTPKSDVARSKTMCVSPMADPHRRSTSNCPHTSFNSLKHGICRPTPSRPCMPRTQSTEHWALAPMPPARSRNTCRQWPTRIGLAPRRACAAASLPTSGQPSIPPRSGALP